MQRIHKHAYCGASVLWHPSTTQRVQVVARVAWTPSTRQNFPGCRSSQPLQGTGHSLPMLSTCLTIDTSTVLRYQILPVECCHRSALARCSKQLNLGEGLPLHCGLERFACVLSTNNHCNSQGECTEQKGFHGIPDDSYCWQHCRAARACVRLTSPSGQTSLAARYNDGAKAAR
jgi:hypothetical protein